MAQVLHDPPRPGRGSVPAAFGASPTAAQQAAIYHEADVRFWAQTGYKVNARLNPDDPADAAWIPAWNEIYATVLTEAKEHGWAVPTHKSSVVMAPLAAAAAAGAAAMQFAHAAADAIADGNHAAHAANVEAAQRAHDEGQVHAAQAARAQPPSLSPETRGAAAAASSAQAQAQASTPPPSGLPDGAKRSILQRAVASLLEANQAAQRAARFDPLAQLSHALPPVATVVPSRDAAASPDGSGVAPGEQPPIDNQGRVQQPSGKPSQASRWWGAIAVGAVCLGAFAAAAKLSLRGNGRRRRRRPRRTPSLASSSTMAAVT